MANTVDPSKGNYYAELIIGVTFCPDHGTKCRRINDMRSYGTNTDYAYAYFDDKPSAEDLDAMVPDGWYRLGKRITKIRR